MKLTDILLDLLYPPKCAFCQVLLEDGEKRSGICARCAFMLENDRSSGRLEGEFFDTGAAAFIYEGNIRKAIHRFKFGGRREYALIFARLMMERIAEDMDIASVDFVTSPPTNRSNIRQRGYDHAELLAVKTAEALGLPYVKTLGKSRETLPMFGLKPDERRANILGSIKLAADPEHIAGKRVLIADDIFTTGATAAECARMLKSAGAERVNILTFAETRKS